MIILLSLIWFLAGGLAHIFVEDYAQGRITYTALYLTVLFAVAGTSLIIILM